MNFIDLFLSISSDDLEMCSLKVLEVDGSPSRSLLRLIGDRGCTLGNLVEFLKMIGNGEAVQCLKSGILQHQCFM